MSRQTSHAPVCTFVLALLLAQAAACSCVMRTVPITADQFNSSAGVHKVKLLERFYGKKGVKSGPQDGSDWSNGQVGYFRFDLVESYKGCDTPPKLLVDTALGTSCSIDIVSIGGTYVVMVDEGDYPSLGFCSIVLNSDEFADYFKANNQCLPSCEES